VCDYKTVRKHNFDKHLKTESHTTKIKQNMTEYDCIKTDANNIMLSATGEQPMCEPMKEQHMIIHTCEKCKFTNLVIEINKMREEEFDKIITSVSKHVAIDKERVKMSGYLN
jgi:hypothetical protein